MNSLVWFTGTTDYMSVLKPLYEDFKAEGGRRVVNYIEVIDRGNKPYIIRGVSPSDENFELIAWAAAVGAFENSIYAFETILSMLRNWKTYANQGSLKLDMPITKKKDKHFVLTPEQRAAARALPNATNEAFAQLFLNLGVFLNRVPNEEDVSGKGYIPLVQVSSAMATYRIEEGRFSPLLAKFVRKYTYIIDAYDSVVTRQKIEVCSYYVPELLALLFRTRDNTPAYKIFSLYLASFLQSRDPGKYDSETRVIWFTRALALARELLEVYYNISVSISEREIIRNFRIQPGDEFHQLSSMLLGLVADTAAKLTGISNVDVSLRRVLGLCLRAMVSENQHISNINYTGALYLILVYFSIVGTNYLRKKDTPDEMTLKINGVVRKVGFTSLKSIVAEASVDGRNYPREISSVFAGITLQLRQLGSIDTVVWPDVVLSNPCLGFDTVLHCGYINLNPAFYKDIEVIKRKIRNSAHWVGGYKYGKRF
uniref:p55 n=1 Tax=Grapevine leafroll-associated virus 1 TaxID=47985 RepID=Q9Q6Q0_9CLOS|nr:p55 [Grapevine leafroll-associated virus 1]